MHTRVHLRRDLRLHAVAERVSLRADIPDQEHGAHGAGRGHRRTHSRRRVLLGPANGGGAAGVDPRRPHFFLLPPALRPPAHPPLGPSLATRPGLAAGPPPPPGRPCAPPPPPL